MSILPRHASVNLSEATLHIAEAGPAGKQTIVFLHGWPQDWSVWLPIMELAAERYHCIAVDLPGIGESKLAVPNGNKFFLAKLIHEFLGKLNLHDATLVGHDVGGMITFAYLKQFPGLRRAVIMNTVIPGIAPWERVLANPYIWHFAFHAVPGLPEMLVRGNVRIYFDYFYDAISARKAAITPEARSRYVASYREESALREGFEFYRAFRQDAFDNTQGEKPIATPTLYLRGTSEAGDIAHYQDGLAHSGMRSLSARLIEGAGHFAPEEAPDQVWSAISAHVGDRA